MSDTTKLQTIGVPVVRSSPSESTYGALGLSLAGEFYKVIAEMTHYAQQIMEQQNALKTALSGALGGMNGQKSLYQRFMDAVTTSATEQANAIKAEGNGALIGAIGAGVALGMIGYGMAKTSYSENSGELGDLKAFDKELTAPGANSFELGNMNGDVPTNVRSRMQSFEDGNFDGIKSTNRDATTKETLETLRAKRDLGQTAEYNRVKDALGGKIKAAEGTISQDTQNRTAMSNGIAQVASTAGQAAFATTRAEATQKSQIAQAQSTVVEQSNRQIEQTVSDTGQKAAEAQRMANEIAAALAQAAPVQAR